MKILRYHTKIKYLIESQSLKKNKKRRKKKKIKFKIQRFKGLRVAGYFWKAWQLQFDSWRLCINMPEGKTTQKLAKLQYYNIEELSHENFEISHKNKIFNRISILKKNKKRKKKKKLNLRFKDSKI